MKALFDTNILIDYLNGVDAAREEIRRYDNSAISPVSWMEVMVGATPENETVMRGFLLRFARIRIADDVAERAVILRKQYRLHLPDAIIWASAQTEQALLVTRNERDFSGDTPDVRIPYRL